MVINSSDRFILNLITTYQFFFQCTESGGRGGVGSEAHGAGYQAKKVEITQFPQQLTIPQNV